MALCMFSASSTVNTTDLFQGTVAFSTVGRSHFGFDIFSVNFVRNPSSESRLTDGLSVNYNGFFATSSQTSALCRTLRHHHDHDHVLVYVSERSGTPQLHFALLFPNSSRTACPISETFSSVHLKDRPSISNLTLFYTSTQQPSPYLRHSWTSVFSTHLPSSLTTRLTPPLIADFSPSVSPNGRWILVASHGSSGWHGEIHNLHTNIYIFNARDGSQRQLIVEDGGWPSWGDDSTFFFHKQAPDGWWSIYRADISHLQKNDDDDDDLQVVVERLTPPGAHCFTPSASPSMHWIALATRRPESDYRHIELFDLHSHTFLPLTQPITPFAHHYNPFLSSDSTLVGYHKCRGGTPDESLFDVVKTQSSSVSDKRVRRLSFDKGAEKAQSHDVIPRLEYVASPFPKLSLVRVDGSFPSFSPDGSLIAYIPKLAESGVNVMRLDGSGSRQIYAEPAFGTVWDVKREGVVYTSSGPIFASEQSVVHIVAIFNAHKLANGEDIQLVSRTLTSENTSNNAFPSPSPDGKYVVFRSGRSGYKNLYIMDAVVGEAAGLWRLTEGEWTDTMCSWSPDGQWIAFSSDRDNPGKGSFALYLIHPNGTGLHKVFKDIKTAGRVNHASFSPNSKTLLFTSDFAGVSAEPISVPHQFQPYGEIFVASLDGTHVERLTHNAYEDGTPSWGKAFISASELSDEGKQLQCSFDDVTWLTNDMATCAHLTKNTG